MDGPFGLARGELVVVDVPPGPAWVRLVHQLWTDRVAFLPLDHRLSEQERRRSSTSPDPAVLEVGGSLAVFAGGAPVGDEVALVMATSGTGGAPRLVELSRDAVTAAVLASRDGLAAVGHDVSAPLVCCLTPAHVGGLLMLLRGELGDLRVMVHDRFEPQRLLREAPPGSMVSLVPTMLRRLVHARSGPGPARHPVGGRCPARGRTPRERRGAGGSRGPDLRADRGVWRRRLRRNALPGTQVRFGESLDGEEAGGRVVGWQAGRIEMFGPTLMEGYRGDPAATGAAFDTGGWLRTGDAGSIADDGRLVVLGRIDDAIRTGGETVWPGEVERALASHPKVSDVAVAGRPHLEVGRAGRRLRRAAPCGRAAHPRRAPRPRV